MAERAGAKSAGGWLRHATAGSRRRLPARGRRTVHLDARLSARCWCRPAEVTTEYLTVFQTAKPRDSSSNCVTTCVTT